MKKVQLIILSCLSGFLLCCSDDNPVINSNTAEVYQKIISVESGSTKFEMWTENNDTLMTGYNKVGFKVFDNGTEKTSGFVKFYAKMFHFTSTEFHATPVEPIYYYNQSQGMFTGYIIMLMPSDTTSRWYGYYNYNDDLFIDSIRFDVGWEQKTKFKIFTDIGNELSYLITMKSPRDAVTGYNEFSCLLHESHDFVNFTQVNTAVMYLRVSLDSLNHQSTDNTNPMYQGNGIYKGRVNFDMPGGWQVYDSIYYNNRCITRDGTPTIYFDVK